MTLISDKVASVRPLRADAERNRRRILAAAAELFATRGLDVGLDEIARHAGVGTGTVYRRFPEKSVLIQALFEDRMTAALALARGATEHPDPWTGLVTLIEGITAMQLADRGLKELMFGDRCAGQMSPDRRCEIVTLIEQLVLRAQKSGQLRPDVDPTDIGLIQLMVNAAGTFTADRRPQVWRRMLSLMLDGLRTSRSEPTALPSGPLSPSDLEELFGISHEPDA